MAAFGGIAPTYHIELLEKPTIYWDFHSLLLDVYKRQVSLCTLLYACFAYQPSVQRQILHAAVKYSTVHTSKMVFKNEIKNSRTGCTACTAILKSIPHF